MGIGQLRHYVNLQNSDDVRNLTGEVEKTWTTFTSVWASIKPLRGREALEFQQINAELTHKIRIRYNASVTAKTRIVWGSRIFDINVVRNIDERNIYMQLICKEAA